MCAGTPANNRFLGRIIVGEVVSRNLNFCTSIYIASIFVEQGVSIVLSVAKEINLVAAVSFYCVNASIFGRRKNF